MCDVELPNAGEISYPVFLHGFLHNLILGLPYPGKFPYRVKSSIHRSSYFFERNNN